MMPSNDLPNSELLTESNLDNSQAEFCNTILTCGQSLLETISDILEYTKVSLGFEMVWYFVQSNSIRSTHFVMKLESLILSNIIPIRALLSGLKLLQPNDVGLLRSHFLT
jgi:signal transduction histidine kinase